MVESQQFPMGWRTRAGVLAAFGLVLSGASLPATAAGGPPLGAARTYAMLGGSTVANTGPSAITGDVGVSPGTEITGFPPGTVTGGIHAGDAAAATAHNDASIAYAFLAGMASLPANNLTGSDLGGMTLAPGVYKFNTSAQLTGTLTLDAQGDSGALFVFQLGSTLTTASGAAVNVINGGADYDESNVFWQVGSSATLGSGTAFTGNILAFSSITCVSGSSMTGNALALNGAVTTDTNTNSSPVIQGPPIVIPPTVAAPLTLIATPVATSACTGADLTWNDASDDETEFRLYRRDGTSPAFVQIAIVPATNTPGTGGVLTFQDLTLVPDTFYTYAVTAFGLPDGESARSNEALLETCEIVVVPPVVPPTRYLDVHLGRRRSLIKDRNRINTDRVSVRGSYVVIDIDTSVPTVLNDADPRTAAFSIQVTGPGNLVLANIAANDPNWKALRRGVYVWKTHNGRSLPMTRIRFNTRKSEFTFKTKRAQLGSVPSNSINVTLTYQGATGSDARVWNTIDPMPHGTRALFKLPK